ncbi:hypothetical protein K4A83_09875 [Spirulina subsalsa FACHB-351]|uniref:Uncharacterized protein n=1 Tax=Spirulina subsalsa FACHB-351 TaxID=234711 RepID=A0ABT3L5V7_9CYAN|nr:hypothetical protein [Spirulina subsalsa]MCW6036567.1 hypothetical protein [Spirulina subsalsa FACHB-351]
MNPKSLILIGFLLFTLPLPLQSCKAPLESTDESNSLEEGFDLMQSETLGGWLKVGLPASAIVDQLGDPPQKGEAVFWGAIGTYVQQWDYPSQGINLQMESEESDGEQRVLHLTLSSPSNLKTRQNIGIGSFRTEVEQAYQEYGQVTPDNPNTFIAGTVYGGIIFEFEDDQVTHIFIGAAAE